MFLFSRVAQTIFPRGKQAPSYFIPLTSQRAQEGVFIVNLGKLLEKVNVWE